ncbi:hypothetical protein N5B56_01385 [Eubacterium sp. LFL-14]|uniref:Uncharacterized protein n=1 Tax=Eubacterium album TaxID=2978477 RepID=A0ABT2LWR5_9FIRM|nr:hypothetical protein [Eubacterium sp. LFL-14]MCT7397738.1 hypothetical protein [Eubacterium sp. LFL-14]
MEFNNRQKKKLLKTNAIIEDIFDNGNIKKYNITTMEADVIARVYSNIVMGNSGRTINGRVKEFFENEGYKIKEDGIGWKINV